MSRTRRDSETSTDSWSIVEDENNESSDHFSMHATDDEDQNDEELNDVEPEPIVEEPASDEDEELSLDSDVTQYSSDEEEEEELPEDGPEEATKPEDDNIVLNVDGYTCRRTNGYWVCENSEEEKSKDPEAKEEEEDEDVSHYNQYEEVWEETLASILTAPMKLLETVYQAIDRKVPKEERVDDEVAVEAEGAEKPETQDAVKEVRCDSESFEESESAPYRACPYDPVESPLQFFVIVLSAMLATIFILSAFECHMEKRIVDVVPKNKKTDDAISFMFNFVLPQDMLDARERARQRRDRYKAYLERQNLSKIRATPKTPKSSNTRTSRTMYCWVTANSTVEITPFTACTKSLDGPLPPANVCLNKKPKIENTREYVKKGIKNSGQVRTLSRNSVLKNTEYEMPYERMYNIRYGSKRSEVKSTPIDYEQFCADTKKYFAEKMRKEQNEDYTNTEVQSPTPKPHQKLAKVQSREVQKFYSPKSTRRVAKRFSPKASPCFENNTSFAPCETSIYKNWPSVIPNKSYKVAEYKPRTYRNKRMTEYHKSYNVSSSKKASQSMRKSFSLKNDEEQCEGRQISKYLPKRKSIMYKPPLPCKAPKQKPTTPSKVLPCKKYPLPGF